MLHQYHAQRRRGGYNPRGISTIQIGEIFYLQDFNPFGGIRGLSPYSRPVCRNPWIVEGFATREYFPAVAGGPPVKYLAGGHLVTVRSLRNGERRQVADWMILRAADCDLEWAGQRSIASQRRRAAASEAAAARADRPAAERRAA